VQGKEIYIMIIYHTTLEIKDMSRKTKGSGCRDTWSLALPRCAYVMQSIFSFLHSVCQSMH